MFVKSKKNWTLYIMFFIINVFSLCFTKGLFHSFLKIKNNKLGLYY